ncbi:hypothetical protein KFL_001350240 [Klebsormidium nitens]|uniref:Dirigent protein n=1 Tax=Klebsormidium nitens TaxID=105231 RepID=A0A1Y1HWR2_KLENI|nr:hypothetical protein KFL_001350240 [Klebsormidium nitens]|eukprot:GAQ83100.1 hypothetical protein KFL_001350240 [Klebsormidium nitens]
MVPSALVLAAVLAASLLALVAAQGPGCPTGFTGCYTSPASGAQTLFCCPSPATSCSGSGDVSCVTTGTSDEVAGAAYIPAPSMGPKIISTVFYSKNSKIPSARHTPEPFFVFQPPLNPIFGTPGDIDNFNDDLLDKPSTDPTAKKIGTLVGWCSLTSVPSADPEVISESAVYGCNIIYKFEGDNLLTAVGFAEEFEGDVSLTELAAITGGYGEYFGATGQVREFHDATGGTYQATIVLPYGSA